MAKPKKKRISFGLIYREPGDLKTPKSGEQSIRTVPQEIKGDLENDGCKGVAKILIPLQQIDKKHWTLLEITSLPSSPSANTAATVTAKHYGSKGFLNGFRDVFAQGKRFVDELV